MAENLKLTPLALILTFPPVLKVSKPSLLWLNSAGDDSLVFNSVNDTAFTVKSNHSDFGSGWNRSDEFTLTLVTDFTTGAITGSSSARDDYVEFDYSEHYYSTANYTGKIIL